MEEIEDIRIVVGFQAREVIREATSYRNDILFVYNHDYFENKTAASYYLGAKDGNPYAIEMDGDLIIHPDDMKRCLQEKGEWVAYTDIKTEDFTPIAIQNNQVSSFQADHTMFEWTGPCCLQKEKIKWSSGHVYDQITPYLPMKGIHIRAVDIDTDADYQMAKKLAAEWFS